LQLGLGQPLLGLENSPFKIPNFSNFSFSSGWVKKYSGQRWADPLFPAGQKYRVRAHLYLKTLTTVQVKMLLLLKMCKSKTT